MKPKIFIGSSKEGLPVAEKIFSGLSHVGDCQMWNTVFDFGSSTYDDLVSQIPLFDFAILLATADDFTISRKTEFHTVRDNVLFEFGLFAGGLGKSKVFYIVEEGTKIPSDLSGITLPFIPKIKDKGFEDGLNDILQKIALHITNQENTYQLGLLPSTAIAYGYFNNFIEKTTQSLLESKSKGKAITVGEQQIFITDLKFTILVPNDLSEDMFKKVAAKRLIHGWEKTKVVAEGVRDYDFSVDTSKVNNGHLLLIDIPLTLNALNLAIELYAGKRHLGKNAKESLLEYREIRNFTRTLEYLINRSSFTKNVVTVEIVEI
ncbi:STING domain-containing protein [uncultured Chitinophaga sp.]|uniref:STING domain-containing protein n=1 Tax=uncultured Chitinophaga sp. TaxID=339340 RepID=UPI0025F2EF5D|nr:STING domain-containing protein [uncultured Chitinophaga sp.]